MAYCLNLRPENVNVLQKEIEDLVALGIIYLEQRLIDSDYFLFKISSRLFIAHF
jgi:hypothetical protein